MPADKSEDTRPVTIADLKTELARLERRILVHLKVSDIEITDEERIELERNGESVKSGAIKSADVVPVVRLHARDWKRTWLLTEWRHTHEDWGGYGAALGCHDKPVMETVYLADLEQYGDPILGVPVDKDPHFVPEKTVGEYMREWAIRCKP